MKGKTVILAAGDFPKKGSEAWGELVNAARVICCDGAAKDYLRRMKKTPFAIVGDFDSWKGPLPKGAEIVRIGEQETNDLAKAVAFCRSRGWRSPIILGATGKREDHALGNIFRALAFGLEIATDFGRFIPVEGKRRLKVQKGAAISVFSTDPEAKVKSKGLEWPLDGVGFKNLYCATLNRASAATVTIETDRPIYLYIASAKSPRSSSTRLA